MFVIGYFLNALAKVLDIVLSIYMWVIIIRALLSWVNPDPYNPIVRTLYMITDPVLNWLRRKLPLFFGGIDFSPMVVILLIIFLRQFLVPTLFKFSMYFM
jgi:YggT family protein